MRLGQLLGKYIRLQAELTNVVWQPAGINRHAGRIAEEMARVEEAIQQAPSEDEQTADTLPGWRYLY